MDEEDNSESQEKAKEPAPYKFKQKDGGMGRKLDDTFGKFSANRKAIVIVIGVLILVVIGGTFTGNVIRTTSDLKKCQNSLSDSYENAALLSSNVTYLQEEVSGLSGNVSFLNDINEQCSINYTSCEDEKSNVLSDNKGLEIDLADTSQSLKNTQSDLKQCSSDLETTIEEKEALEAEKEVIEKQYASYKCCAFYSEGYTYYTSTESEIKCCYLGSDGYVCGFGPAEAKTGEELVRTLNC